MHTRKNLTAFLISIAAFLAVLAIGFGLYALIGGSPVKNNPGIGNRSISPYAILKPATVPSKTAECQQTLTYASNGNPSPLQCTNGDLNVLAWNALSALEPTVMKLGYNASQSQVESAICVDANVADLDSTPAISEPLEASAYALASLYYGWSFNLNPQSVIAGC
jgi:hypothetical protein